MIICRDKVKLYLGLYVGAPGGYFQPLSSNSTNDMEGGGSLLYFSRKTHEFKLISTVARNE